MPFYSKPQPFVSQAFSGNESWLFDQHHEPTHANLTESGDASEPDRLERGGTVQPLLQLTLQVRESPLTLILPHTRTHVKGNIHSGLKPFVKQFTRT